MYSLHCSYYNKEFYTLDELLADILESGMDPNYLITIDGEISEDNAFDHLYL